MPFPFEVGFDEVQSNLDAHVDAVFGCLESEFLVMPRGKGFVEFSTFEMGYEALKRATGNFRDVTPEKVAPVVFEIPISMIVLRCMLGSRRRSGLLRQPAHRCRDHPRRGTYDRPEYPHEARCGFTEKWKRYGTAHSRADRCRLSYPRIWCSRSSSDNLHRFDKADTRAGLASLRSVADLGIPIPFCSTSAFSAGRLPAIGTPSASLSATSSRTR